MLHKRPKHASDINEEVRTRNGLHSLLMMLLGAALAVAVGAFLYLSPFFNLKPPAIEEEKAVTPIATDKPKEYEFYNVLPDQEFRSAPEGVSVQSRVVAQSDNLKVDAVAKEETTQNGETSEDAATPTDLQKNANQSAQKNSEPLTPIADTAPDLEPTQGKIQIGKANPNTTYVLQIRSYDNAELADQRRAEVIMAGVDAEVVKKNMDGQTLYQVVSTPMISRDSAMSAYLRLQNAGIDAVIVEQKRK